MTEKLSKELTAGSGAASLAAEQGLPDAQISHLGRWKSDAFQLYIRQPTGVSKIAFQSWARATHISSFCLLVTPTQLRHGLVVSYRT